ncbi:unnamed protein product, partial [Prorocentrum cordatum]
VLLVEAAVVPLPPPLLHMRLILTLRSYVPPRPHCWRRALSSRVPRRPGGAACTPGPPAVVLTPSQLDAAVTIERTRLARVVEDAARQLRLACQEIEQKRTKTQKIREQLEETREALRAAEETQCGAQRVQRDADQAMQSFDPQVWKAAKAAEAREAEAERLRQQRAAPPAAATAARAAAEPARPGDARAAGDAGPAPMVVVEPPDFATKSADEFAAWAREHNVPAGLWEAFVAMRATIQSAEDDAGSALAVMQAAVMQDHQRMEIPIMARAKNRTAKGLRTTKEQINEHITELLKQ